MSITSVQVWEYPFVQSEAILIMPLLLLWKGSYEVLFLWLITLVLQLEVLRGVFLLTLDGLLDVIGTNPTQHNHFPDVCPNMKLWDYKVSKKPVSVHLAISRFLAGTTTFESCDFIPSAMDICFLRSHWHNLLPWGVLSSSDFFGAWHVPVAQCKGLCLWSVNFYAQQGWLTKLL